MAPPTPQAKVRAQSFSHQHTNFLFFFSQRRLSFLFYISSFISLRLSFLLPLVAEPTHPRHTHTCWKQTMQSDYQYHSVSCLFVPQARIWMISRSSCWGIKANEPMLIYSRFHFTERVLTCIQEHTNRHRDAEDSSIQSVRITIRALWEYDSIKLLSK